MSFIPPSNRSSEITDAESEESFCNLARKLHVETEDKEQMKVFLRIRLPTDAEKDMILHTVTEDKILTVDANQNVSGKVNASCQKFVFSKVFKPGVGQQEIYEATVQSILEDFICGRSSVVFNYGVTNAGKTYTMQGTEAQPGIVPRALEAIFLLLKGKLTSTAQFKPHNGKFVLLTPLLAVADARYKEQLLHKYRDTASSSIMGALSISRVQRECSMLSTVTLNSTSATCSSEESCYDFSLRSLNGAEPYGPCTMWVSFVEIYNEHIFDLLTPCKKIGKRVALPLFEQTNGNIFVKGAKEIQVNSAAEAYSILLVGRKNLSYASTKLNESSSRSHCIFTIKLLCTGENGTPNITQLSFCDLAGSERNSKTQSHGDRLREAGLINTSLLVFGRCIEVLRANQNRGKENQMMIPFRESKLTRILQNFFTGKGRAVMIVNISPCMDMFDETMHVLKFSAIASEVILSELGDYLAQSCQASKSTLALLRRSLGVGRDSVPWDSNCTYSRSHSSVITEEEEEESSEEEEDEIDYEQKCYELADIIRNLMGRLSKERDEKMKMEVEVREELCNHFMAQIQQLEEFYREQNDKVFEDAENVADERFHLWEFYQNKRPRDDDTEQSRSTVIDDSTERILELETKVKDLEQDNAELKKNLETAVAAEARARELYTTLEFQTFEIKQKAAALDAVIAQNAESKRELCGTLEAREQAISQLEKAVSLNAEERQELRDCLKAKELTIVELENTVKALNERLETASNAGNSSEKQLAETEPPVPDIAKRVQNVQGKFINKLAELFEKCQKDLKLLQIDTEKSVPECEIRRSSNRRQTVYYSASSSGPSGSDSPNTTYMSDPQEKGITASESDTPMAMHRPEVKATRTPGRKPSWHLVKGAALSDELTPDNVKNENDSDVCFVERSTSPFVKEEVQEANDKDVLLKRIADLESQVCELQDEAIKHEDTEDMLEKMAALETANCELKKAAAEKPKTEKLLKKILVLEAANFKLKKSNDQIPDTEELLEKIANLEADNGKLKKRINEFPDTQNLMDKIAALDATNRKLERSVAEKEDTGELLKKIAFLEEANGKLKNHICDSAADTQELLNKMAALKATNCKLEKIIAEKEDAGELLKKIAVLESAKTKLEELNKANKSDMKQLLSDNAELLGKIKMYEDIKNTTSESKKDAMLDATRAVGKSEKKGTSAVKTRMASARKTRVLADSNFEDSSDNCAVIDSSDDWEPMSIAKSSTTKSIRGNRRESESEDENEFPPIRKRQTRKTRTVAKKPVRQVMAFEDSLEEVAPGPSSKRKHKVPLSVKTTEILVCSPEKGKRETTDVHSQVLRKLRQRK